jgi:hypothetical protein
MCRVCKKMLWSIKNCWIWWHECFFFLVILSELIIITCVIRFGRFVRVLKDQWKC